MFFATTVLLLLLFGLFLKKLAAKKEGVGGESVICVGFLKEKRVSDRGAAQ